MSFEGTLHQPGNEHTSRKKEESPQTSRFESEVSVPMLADREQYYTGDMSFDELWQKWGSQFNDSQDFCIYLGIVDPVYEGSIQEQIDRDNRGGIYLRYGIESNHSPMPEGTLFLEPRKTKDKLRIATSVLPMQSLGMGNVTAEMIDISGPLLDKLKLVDEQLFIKIVKSIRFWEKVQGKRVLGDGSVINVSRDANSSMT